MLPALSNIPLSTELSSVSIDMEAGPSPPHTPPLAIPENASKIKIIGSNETQTHYQKTSRDKEEQLETGEDIGFVLGNNMDLSKQAREKYERQQWKARKYMDHNYSSDVDDAEPELEAIPESPKSESSSHQNSIMGSVAELTDLRSTVTVETARIRVERPPSSSDEEGLVILNPSVEIAERPTVIIDPTAKVECHMEHQLQAFERSWVSSSSDSSHDNTQLEGKTPDISSATQGLSEHYPHYDNAFNRVEMHKECNSDDKSKAANAQTVLGRALHDHMIRHNSVEKQNLLSQSQVVEPTFITAEPYGPVTELKEIKVFSYRDENEPSNHKLAKNDDQVGASRGFNGSKNGTKLEILDARQLEESICKTEPAVVKQVEHISTSQTTSGIKTQKYAMKTYEVPVPSNYQRIKQAADEQIKPFTIKLPSSSKCESVQTVPCQERLLPVGMPSIKIKDQKFQKEEPVVLHPNWTEVGTQVSEAAKSHAVPANMPPLTSAIVRHTINPVVQTVSTQSSKDSTTLSMSLQYPSQERLLPVGMSPKSRGSPATPTRRWKLLVHDIDIGEDSKGKGSGQFTAEAQIIVPPVKMQAKVKYVQPEDQPEQSSGSKDGKVIKTDTRIYQGPAKGEPKLQTGAKSKLSKSIITNPQYAVIEPQHYFIQHSTEISRQNFTRSLQTALKELHQQQDESKQKEIQSAGQAVHNKQDVCIDIEEEDDDFSFSRTDSGKSEIQNVTIDLRDPKVFIDVDRRPSKVSISASEIAAGLPSNDAQNGDLHQKNLPSTSNSENESKLINPPMEVMRAIPSNFEVQQESMELHSLDDDDVAPLKSLPVATAIVVSTSIATNGMSSSSAGLVSQAQEVSLESSVINLESNAICLEPKVEYLAPLETLTEQFLDESCHGTDDAADQGSDSSDDEVPGDDMPAKNIYRQRKQRKTGLGTFEPLKTVESR